MTDKPDHALELRSTITPDGGLRLSLETVAIPAPGDDEVVVRVEAAPLNPSDLGLLTGPADLSTMRKAGSPDHPELIATVPPARMAAMKPRLGQSLPVGNEGAGTVVAAGKNAQALLGQRVGMWGGAMYTQYRTLPVRDCILLPEGASAADGASMFVNPLTALAMVETMRREGHTALVHTAAASNLGQMLNRICLADGVALVNIVRSPAQADLLRGIGARHIVDSSSESFAEDLANAVDETGATICFDAIGGGWTANSVLHAMEASASRRATTYNRYGSSTFKQVYIYGMLDTGPTELDRGFGLTWAVSGFLLMNFLGKAGPEVAARLRERVARELTTTFASHYTRTISLADLFDPAIVSEITKKATGQKFLLDPSL